ncbi:MAG: hypothetical protein U1F65_00200 [Verrucomicrobiota bacterium]
MRKFIFIGLALWLCGWSVGAETFQLADGKTVTGEVIMGSVNDNGLQVRVDDSQYERIPWSSFTQDDLKKFMQNPKFATYVEPFIEVSQEEKLKKTEVTINPVPRLEKPAAGSLIGGIFSSGLGIVIVLLVYLANLYAAFEVAVYKARPFAVVCGAAAVLPLLGPIIFLCLPALQEAGAAAEEAAEAAAAAANAPAAGAPGAPGPIAPAPASRTMSASAVPAGSAAPDTGGLHISHESAAAHAAEAALPQTQTFQRGAFTFNRRFFETKFAAFFGVVRKESDKDMVMVIKSARGEYLGTRISRISANDLHLDVHKGHASEEVMIPFTEIKEAQLKHKDAK